MLLETLKRHWWVPVLRGVAAIIFGVIAFTHPVMAAATLVLFFGAWVLIDGIFRIVGAIGHRDSDPDWGFNLIIGILGVIVGLLTFRAPGITALALVIYIAAWALMIGATEIALAIKMRREIKGEWFLILMGLASIIFAGLLLWNPLAGAAALIWIIAWYAVIMGVLAIVFGFRLRSLPSRRPHSDQRHTSSNRQVSGTWAVCDLLEAPCRSASFFSRPNPMAPGLLKKIRLNIIDWPITVRRWNMIVPISRLDFAMASRRPLLRGPLYEKSSPYYKDATTKSRDI